MNWVLSLPILIPLVAAVALQATGPCGLRRAVGVGAAGAHAAAAAALVWRVHSEGVQAMQAGSWPAPFGVTLVADHLGALMTAACAVVGLAAAVFALSEIDARYAALDFYGYLHVLLAGVTGAFLTGDLFNLYVWFEVMLVASFAMLVLEGRPAQLEGAVKYVVLNLVSSLLLLAAIGFLYGATGTLNLAHLAVRVPALDSPGLVGGVAVVLMLALGIKAAVFPLYHWLPASYPTAPMAVAAVFSGLLTKVGVYALIRVFTLLFARVPGFTFDLLMGVAVLTMVAGVLGAVAQSDIRRILSVHIVSQVGYLCLGLALLTPGALLGAVYYTVHIIVVKPTLFLLAGVVRRTGGSYDLRRPGGLWPDHPWIAGLFLVPALSLAGVPPLSGFWAKLALARAAVEAGEYALVAAIFGVGLLTLLSMTKIWVGAFWTPRDSDGDDRGRERSRRADVLALAPVAALAALTLVLGLWAEPLLDLSRRAAHELLDPSGYIAAVLGEAP